MDKNKEQYNKISSHFLAALIIDVMLDCKIVAKGIRGSE